MINSEPIIVLLGKNGQLGWEFNRCLQPLGQVIALDYPDVDFSQPTKLAQQIEALKPNLIVNAAAYTNVDKAESEPELCDQINHLSPRALAEVARKVHAALVHISTDYVFDGSKDTPYTESDPPNPINYYASSKLSGELAVVHNCPANWVIRTAWLYSLRQNDFVRRVLEWSRKQEVMRVVDDQIGSPTWARMLAETITLALAGGKDAFNDHLTRTSGIYHLGGDGYTSRFLWVQKILALDPQREDQTAGQILAAKTSQFPTPAQRPLYTALDCTRFYNTFGLRLPAWDTSLALAMESLL
jgi:dTDP-4-dehydrorhamnose reductase